MNRILFVSLLLLTLVMEVLLPRRGGLELSLQPQRVLLLSQYQIGSSYPGNIGQMNARDGASRSIPFRLGSYYGFHDRELNLLSYDALKEPLPMSHRILAQDFYLDLSSSAGQVIVRDIARAEIGRFPGPASAFIVKNAIYQLSSEGHSLYRYSRSGKLEWRSDLLPYITGLDNNAQGDTLLSYVNGQAVLLNPAGKLDNEYTSSGSRINSIYGAALSADSSSMALIAGLDQQRFIFLQKRQGTYVFAYAKTLSNQLRSSQWLRFSDSYPYIFYHSAGGVSVYDFERGKNRPYQGPGMLHSFAEQRQSDIQFFVFKASSDSLLASKGTRGALLRLELFGEHYSLQVHGDTLYLGQDNLIAAYRTEYL